MSRGTLALDRVATVLAALVCLVAGAAALVWWSGRTTVLPESVDAAPVTDVTGQSWWPWALGLAGVVLILLGLRWLTAHLPQRGVGLLALPGSSSEGRLQADAGTVADAAAEELGGVRGVRSSRGTVQRDRGQVVVRLTATIEPDADLDAVARGADRASGQLQDVLGRDDLHCRVQLRVAGRGRPQPRVH